MTDGRKTIIRIGRNTLSMTIQDASNLRQPVTFQPYVVRGGISMAANLREALKTDFAEATQRVQVMMDTSWQMVPVEQFEVEDIEMLFDYAVPARGEQRSILYNVLPDLNAVCVFGVNKDMYRVINDRFDNAIFIHSMGPVWRHLYQRNFTGHRNKLYGYFHGKRLDIFSFQQNRFKFCNTFEATHSHDVLYYLLYVWKQLRLEPKHDELHIVGDIPEQDWLTQELKRYLQKTYVINPPADFKDAAATKIAGMPYDLMTLIVKGR